MAVLQNRKYEFVAQLYATPPAKTLTAIATAAGLSNKQAVNKILQKPHVKARVSEIKSRAAAKAGISLERVMQEFAAVGFARATDYMRIGDDGLPVIDFSAMTDEQKAALAEITVDQLDVVRDGKTGKETQRVKFKMHDKLQALTRLREHLGFTNKGEITLPGGGVIEFVSGFSGKKDS